jgi:hypothetical protein
MVRSPLVWLDEPDPVASVDATLIEDPELADICELFDRWLDELRFDMSHMSASIIEAWSVAPAGFNPNPTKEFLLRVAGDKNGDISVKRFGEWLRRISGRVVRASNSRRYRLVREQALTRTGRAAFRLEEVV